MRRRGRCTSARSSCLRARDDVYFKLGNIAYKRNERERASELWHRALELNPKHELVKANLDTLSTLS